MHLILNHKFMDFYDLFHVSSDCIEGDDDE